MRRLASTVLQGSSQMQYSLSRTPPRKATWHRKVLPILLSGEWNSQKTVWSCCRCLCMMRARRKNQRCPAIHAGSQKNLECKMLRKATRGGTQVQRLPFPWRRCWETTRCRRIDKARHKRQTAGKCCLPFPNLRGTPQNFAGTLPQTLSARFALTP